MMADIIPVPYVIQVRRLTNFHGRASQMVINLLGFSGLQVSYQGVVMLGGRGESRL